MTQPTPVSLVTRARNRTQAATTMTAIATHGMTADRTGTAIHDFSEAAALCGFPSAAAVVSLETYGALVRESFEVNSILANPSPALASMRGYFQERLTAISNLRTACALWNANVWSVLESHAADSVEEARGVRSGQP